MKFNLTPEEAAKKLREFAELTASNSQNWDNFEKIARDMLVAAMKATKEGNNP